MNASRPDPKPIFTRMLEWALELGILTHLSLTRALTPLLIFEALKEDAPRRARIYGACTGMAPKFAVKLDALRQADDLDMAIETDQAIAEEFVKEVGIESYVELFPLRQIYEVLKATDWTEVHTYRVYGARIAKALVEHDAFAPESTCQRVLDSITIDALFGDQVPATLRVRMAKAIDKRGREREGNRLVGEILFGKDGAVTFEELAEHLDAQIVAAPAMAYADLLELTTSVPPPTADDVEDDGEGGDGEAAAEGRTSQPPGSGKREVVIDMSEDEEEGAAP